ncbi:MAG: hypothetical protein H6577_03255 [Lewinellaceae bacterium]|nr:hypothetical protein [Saprospiraceae bacterium]MCB9337129.1 hypothetical protein [Lewinellaceae bacterium]
MVNISGDLSMPDSCKDGRENCAVLKKASFKGKGCIDSDPEEGVKRLMKPCWKYISPKNEKPAPANRHELPAITVKNLLVSYLGEGYERMRE